MAEAGQGSRLSEPGCECIEVGDWYITNRCLVHNPFLRDTIDMAEKFAELAMLAALAKLEEDAT